MRIPTTWTTLVGVLVTLLPALCFAQAATTPEEAVLNAHMGQVLQLSIDDTETQKWYLYQVVAGRSYCAEVGAYEWQNKRSDSVVTVYRANTTTVIGEDDDAFENEPFSHRGSRVCFIAPASEATYVRVADLPAGTNYYTLRLVETTIWASWFFIGGDYNSFVLLRNTTNTNVNYTMTWRNPAGAIVGSTSGTVSGNAAIVLNTRTYVTNPAEANGSVEIAHTGSPQALGGQVTTLSATTGLNFDSAFFQRQTW
jgi:hypothetical protein